MVDARPTGILLLAAGASTRMGRPKQLLEVGGEPLLRRVARTALDAGLQRVLVVLGAHAARIRPVIEDLGLGIVLNPDWAEGLASSLRAGVTAIERELPEARGVIVMMADQPRTTAAHLTRLDAAQRAGGASIVATDYGDYRGPPAFIGRQHFPALMSLAGDVGARELLRGDGVQGVAAPAVSGADVDSPPDFQGLRDEWD